MESTDGELVYIYSGGDHHNHYLSCSYSKDLRSRPTRVFLRVILDIKSLLPGFHRCFLSKIPAKPSAYFNLLLLVASGATYRLVGRFRLPAFPPTPSTPFRIQPPLWPHIAKSTGDPELLSYQLGAYPAPTGRLDCITNY